MPYFPPAGGSGGGVAISAGLSAATSGTVVFSNSNNVSFGLNGATVTASAAGGGGVAVSAGTNSTSTGTVAFSNSNGVTFGMNTNGVVTGSVVTNYLTTAAQSNQVVNSINGSTGTFSFNAGSSLSSSRVGNAITWGLASNITTALQSTGNYLTTAMASNAGSNFVQATAGFFGTNASGTIGSNGISVSVAAPGGGGGTITAYANGNTGGQSSSTTFNVSSLPISGMGAVTVGYSAGNLIISGGTAAAAPVGISAGTSSASLSNIVFSNLNEVSFGLSGSTITASVNSYSTVGTATTVYPVGTANASVGTSPRWAAEDHVHAFQDVTESVFWRPNDLVTTVGAPINASASVVYCPIYHNLSASRFDLIGSVNVATAANNSTAGFLYSITAVAYTRNGNTLSSVSSIVTNNQMTWTNNATGSVTGAFFFSAPLAFAGPAGKYWFGLRLSTRATGLTGAATTSLGNTVSMMGVGSAVAGALSVREPGAGTANSNGWFVGMGMYSGTSNFSTIALSNLTQQGTNMNRANVAMRMLGV